MLPQPADGGVCVALFLAARQLHDDRRVLRGAVGLAAGSCLQARLHLRARFLIVFRVYCDINLGLCDTF